jgi:hypothetical protein
VDFGVFGTSGMFGDLVPWGVKIVKKGLDKMKMSGL